MLKTMFTMIFMSTLFISVSFAEDQLPMSVSNEVTGNDEIVTDKFLACVSSKNVCARLAQEHGHSSFKAKRDYNTCYRPRPVACYGVD